MRTQTFIQVCVVHTTARSSCYAWFTPPLPPRVMRGSHHRSLLVLCMVHTTTPSLYLCQTIMHSTCSRGYTRGYTYTERYSALLRYEHSRTVECVSDSQTTPKNVQSAQTRPTTRATADDGLDLTPEVSAHWPIARVLSASRPEPLVSGIAGHARHGSVTPSRTPGGVDCPCSLLPQHRTIPGAAEPNTLF